MTDGGLHIRRGRAEDSESIIALHLRTLAAAGFDVRGGNRSRDLDDVQAAFIDTGGESLVAERAGVMVGIGGLTRIDTATAKLRRMRVEPGLQRTRIGSRLLQALEQRAVELGIKTIVLDTNSRLKSAQRFYPAQGYIETHRETRDHDTLIWYRKVLSPSA